MQLKYICQQTKIISKIIILITITNDLPYNINKFVIQVISLIINITFILFLCYYVHKCISSLSLWNIEILCFESSDCSMNGGGANLGRLILDFVSCFSKSDTGGVSFKLPVLLKRKYIDREFFELGMNEGTSQQSD